MTAVTEINTLGAVLGWDLYRYNQTDRLKTKEMGWVIWVFTPYAVLWRCQPRILLLKKKLFVKNQALLKTMLPS